MVDPVQDAKDAEKALLNTLNQKRGAVWGFVVAHKGWMIAIGVALVVGGIIVKVL